MLLTTNNNNGIIIRLIALLLLIFHFFTLLSKEVYASSSTTTNVNNVTSSEDAHADDVSIRHRRIRKLDVSAIPLNHIDDSKILPNLFSSSSNTKQKSIILDNKRKKLIELIKSTKNCSNSIYHFIESCIDLYIRKDIIILYWDKDGILDEASMKSGGRGWWQANIEYDNTKPSKYGKVALLLATDVLFQIPWLMTPPIPILSFTISKEHDPLYRVIPHVYDRRGNYKWRKTLSNDIMSNSSYYKRKNIIIWRGEVHGDSDSTRLIVSKMSSNNTNKETWLDAAITNHKDPFNINRLSTEYMALQYKYQFDIGGMSGTSWGGLRWKMCTGNLVFKVETNMKDWWHDYIQPYKHYIPVNEDLNNLREAYEWVESHPNEVDEIRKNGAKICYETVSHEAIYNYEQKVMNDIPSATKEMVEEVKLIRDGLLKYKTDW